MKAADIYFGLSPLEIRRLALDYAQSLNLNIPASWVENGLAGYDWFKGFMKRHSSFISIRTPEATSLARISGFNKPKVNDFFDNLQSLMDRYHFTPGQIYNADETGITTVQKPNRVVARKGVKQVGRVTSFERGTLVTLVWLLLLLQVIALHHFLYSLVKTTKIIS